MKPGIALALFAVVAVAQWAVPGWMIRGYQTALREGEPIKIRCMPVDPADAFRGRYVSINLDLGNPRGTLGDLGYYPQKPWVTLEVGEDGFARWGEVVAKKPESGMYVQTDAWQGWAEGDEEIINAAAPLDRFYMNEWRAPAAERAYFDAMREAPTECYVAARVLNGLMVLEELYLDGVPIGEYVEQAAQEEYLK